MKRLLPLLALILLTAATNAQQYVNGYQRQNGTYVQPYYRSSPNSTVNDNYSTRGNVNPFTGASGTRSPSYSSPSSGSSSPYGSGNGYGGSQRRSSY